MTVSGSGGIESVAGEIDGTFASGLIYNAVSCNDSMTGEVSAGNLL
ncbi:MAG: hypothetical protein KUG81_01245 [Gammaproteobacteria bacterium]|nr:hypothetical protein [Gammaproteobacteria bacterium]